MAAPPSPRPRGRRGGGGGAEDRGGRCRACGEALAGPCGVLSTCRHRYHLRCIPSCEQGSDGLFLCAACYCPFDSTCVEFSQVTPAPEVNCDDGEHLSATPRSRSSSPPACPKRECGYLPSCLHDDAAADLGNDGRADKARMAIGIAVFRALDVDHTGRLPLDALQLFANLAEFDLRSAGVRKAMGLLTELSESEGGIDEAVFLSFINDTSEDGLHCEKKTLLSIHAKLALELASSGFQEVEPAVLGAHASNVAHGVSESAFRAEAVEDIFRMLDANENGHLSSKSMRQFAKMIGFTGKLAEWREEFRAICAMEGCQPSVGIDFASFVELVDDDVSEHWAYCTDEELQTIRGELLQQAAAAAAAQATESKRISSGPPKANARMSLIRKIFALLTTSAFDSCLGCGEMLHFAKLCGFPGSEAEWHREFKKICAHWGVRGGRVSESVFTDFVDDKSERGCYCSDAELVDVLTRLVEQQGPSDQEPERPLPVTSDRRGATRRCLQLQLFDALDRDGNGHLDCSEMWQFAEVSGFEGSWHEWRSEFRIMCRQRGVDRSKGLSSDAFVSLLDDRSQQGCFCTTRELTRIKHELGTMPAPPPRRTLARGVAAEPGASAATYREHNLESLLRNHQDGINPDIQPVAPRRELCRVWRAV